MNNEILVVLVRAGMVLVNIRIWKDFISARDSGLVPVGAVVYKPESSKSIPEFYKNIKSSEEVTKKDSEETVLKSNSGRTLTKPELCTTNVSMISSQVIGT